MPNTRGNPDWDVILEVTGSPQWLDVPHHDAFRERRSTHNQRREDREDTQNEELIKLSLKFSTPPRNVSVSVHKLTAREPVPCFKSQYLPQRLTSRVQHHCTPTSPKI